MELLLPNRIQVSKNGLGTLLVLPNLHSHIRVTGSCLVLGLQALGTHHCNPDTHRRRLQEYTPEIMSPPKNDSILPILEHPLSAPCTGADFTPSTSILSPKLFPQSLAQESLPLPWTLTDHLPRQVLTCSDTCMLQSYAPS